MKITLFTIHVQDMAKSIDFYEKILGMKIIREMQPQKGFRLVFLQDEGEVMVELIEDKSITFLDTVTSNVSMGIFIDDMETMLAFLKKQKISIKRGPVSVPNGNKLLFIRDPNGVEIEFIQGRI